MKIHLRKPSFNSAVTGILYVECGETCYPSADWDDFLLRVAAWWSEAALRLYHGHSRVKFSFMDGPYSFTAESISNNNVKLTFEKSDFSHICPVKELFRELKAANKYLIEAAQERHYTSDDLEDLVRVNDKLLAVAA